MSEKWNHRVTALAGVFQAAALVQQLATTGSVNNKQLEVSIQSLFNQNPNSVVDVYGRLSDLELGLEKAHHIFKRSNTENGDIIVRYVMGILHLQKKLMKRTDMLEIISSRLQQAQQQATVFDTTHDNVIASLADIYTSTLSTFSFRIQVMGDYNYLQQQRVGNQVRVLLFAGIRSAILWRQMGGNRLQVIFKRQDIITSSGQLLKQAKEELLH